MLNICFDFCVFKQKMSSGESKIIRNCGEWLGKITLEINKPILSRELNIKQRLFDSIENRSVGKVVTLVCKILLGISSSVLFKKNNPYIMAILSILSEILNDETIKSSTKAHIHGLFTDLAINRNEITYFGYVKLKRLAQQSRNKFFIHCLPNYIHIDTDILGPSMDQMEGDLK